MSASVFPYDDEVYSPYYTVRVTLRELLSPHRARGLRHCIFTRDNPSLPITPLGCHSGGLVMLDYIFDRLADYDGRIATITSLSTMGPWYGYKPPHPRVQRQRLLALPQLAFRGIPCILWGEDALNFVHRVPTGLFDLQILVPDECLERASSVLQEGPYFQAPFPKHYFDSIGPHVNRSGYPKGIFLQHVDVRDSYPYNSFSLCPPYILLLPQSYFGFDVRDKERFQSLVPPLDSDPSNEDILAPKYHTFLEGLVAFNLNPPIPLETQHGRTRVNHDIFIGYLLRYRIQWKDDYFDRGDDDKPPGTELLPEERLVLDELQTEDARWYVGRWFENKVPGPGELRGYNRQKASRSCVSRLPLSRSPFDPRLPDVLPSS